MAARSEIVASLPPGAFLENLAVGPDGAVHVTSYLHREVVRFEPGGGGLPTFCRLDAHPVGIASVADGRLVLTVHEDNIFEAAEGRCTNAIWTLSPDGRVAARVGVPGASLLNGIAALAPGLNAAAGSDAGVVRRHDAAAGRAEPWLTDPLLAPADPAGRHPAANGVKPFGGCLYVSNRVRGLLLRARLDDPRGAPGPLEAVRGGIAIDDFAFAEDGTLFGATHGETVVRLRPGGRPPEIVADAGDGVEGCTAVAFGRTMSDRTSVYVSCDGGPAAGRTAVSAASGAGAPQGGAAPAAPAMPRFAVPAALVLVWALTGSNFLAFKVAMESLPPTLDGGPAPPHRRRRPVAVGARSDPPRRRARPPWPAAMARGRGRVGAAARRGARRVGLGRAVPPFGPDGGVLVLVADLARPVRSGLVRPAAGPGRGGRHRVGLRRPLDPGAALVGEGRGVDAVGAGAAVVGAMGWAVGSLYSRRAPALPKRALVSAAMQMLVAGGALVLLAAALGEFGRVSWSGLTARSLAALAYLVVLGSIMGFGLFVWLVQAASAPLANTFNHVAPVVAVALGALALGEPVTWTAVLACAVTLSGVALMVASPSRPTGAAAAPSKADAVRHRTH